MSDHTMSVLAIVISGLSATVSLVSAVVFAIRAGADA